MLVGTENRSYDMFFILFLSVFHLLFFLCSPRFAYLTVTELHR